MVPAVWLACVSLECLVVWQDCFSLFTEGKGEFIVYRVVFQILIN